MNDKYRFTGEEKIFCGRTLKRIVALKDFWSIKRGDVGGWIETEKNLSIVGSAWVSGSAYVSGSACVSGSAYVSGSACVLDSAKVSGSAWVADSACVSDSARVSGSAWVSDSARISGSAYITESACVSDSARVLGSALINFDVSRTNDYSCIQVIGSRDSCLTFSIKKDVINTGCFSGTLEEFEKEVIITHTGTVYEKQYLLAIKFIKEFKELME